MACGAAVRPHVGFLSNQERRQTMKQYVRNLVAAIVCFLFVVLLNFLLPRLLPGNPIAYLSGFAEEDLTSRQIEYYTEALHLNEPILRQFDYYLRSLTDGTLGYSFKKKMTVSILIEERIGATLQITVPSLILSTVLGLIWGLLAGYGKNRLFDRLSCTFHIFLNVVPGFLTGLLFIIYFGFQNRLFPYTGLSSRGMVPGEPGFLLDRVQHLVLPVLTLTAGVLPSRFLLIRNTAATVTSEKYVLYAKERGFSSARIRYHYILKNIIQPFLTMLGMSVSLCIGGSLIIENIFSIKGMGQLLTDAVYTLDYPLMQGILFVITLMTTLSIVVTDLLCLLLDPRVYRGSRHG